MTKSHITESAGMPAAAKRPRYKKAVGSKLKPWLQVVLGLFALLCVNAVYLLGVRILEAGTGETYQNWFYMNMFLLHLALGFLFVLPVIVFGFAHLRNTYNRPNRRAVKVGYALFLTAIVLLVSGVVLTRIEGLIVVKDPLVRNIAYWLHVITPVAAAWLFVLHRLAGKRIQWRTGRRWGLVALVLGGLALVFQAQDPRRWNVEGPQTGEQYFFPSLARTATGGFIPAKVLQNDEYCAQCHSDVHDSWSNSVHKFSSFNNPPYLSSVRETRRVSLERDGSVQASRFCAGCHDPVVFFSGKFDDPNFDDVGDETGQAGITCTVCHSITHLNSPRGNADYTIDEPEHYPFAFSENTGLQWVNQQLVKAKPELHKKTFLKPLHQTAEFCGTCHKVHLPEELNGYKWLRGQNHYDSFLLSGVSGHGVGSFYYPETAQKNCNGCHMELESSGDFGAKRYDEQEELGLAVHSHLFPSANTGIAHLLELPDWVLARHQAFNEGVIRIDLFGLRKQGRIDGELIAPLRPEVPELEPGQSYLLETVIRTLKIGHLFTEGTADSNEVWVDVQVEAGGRVIGRSGGLSGDDEAQDQAGNAVDPWSHFVNSYVLDKNGKRIDRRNAEDIFVALYNHQIPPGAADVIHYRLDVPEDVRAPIAVEVSLKYRKFDTTYMRHVYGADYVNNLPIMTLATDRVVFPVRGEDGNSNGSLGTQSVEIPEWQRFNDYGIGLLRKGGKSKGQLRGAEEAFARVEALGRPEGPVNLARVYLQQGTVQDKAIAALERASTFDPAAPSWSVAWFGAQVDKQNGFLDEAIEKYRSIVELDTEETRRRGFDFSFDYQLLNELGQTLFERARQERGEARADSRVSLLQDARFWLSRTLEIDPENTNAHYNLSLIFQELGDDEQAQQHLDAYLKYKVDDNSRDRAVSIARRENEAADHAADAIVIYDLRREGAYGYPGSNLVADGSRDR